MLKHSNPEVQLLVEMLESQRDNAMAQSAGLFRENTELKQKLAELSKEMTNATNQIDDTQGNE